MRYVQARQWQLLDTVNSMCSLSVLLSVEMTHTTQMALALAWWPSSEMIHTCVCILCILAAATIQGQSLFYSELPIVRLLLRAASIRSLHIILVYTIVWGVVITWNGILYASCFCTSTEFRRYNLIGWFSNNYPTCTEAFSTPSNLLKPSRTFQRLGF